MTAARDQFPVDQLEDDALGFFVLGGGEAETVALSQAISLKRIADALEPVTIGGLPSVSLEVIADRLDPPRVLK